MRDALLADDGLLLLDEPDGAHRPPSATSSWPTRRRTPRSARDLAAYGIPLSLQHDDLHDNNVFAPAEPGGPLRVFDWGDAVVGHPFGDAAHQPAGSCPTAGDLEPGAAELLRLRDAYLEAWTGDHDATDLVEAARLAVRVDGVSRADCYRRATMEWDRGYRTTFDEGVPSWLRDQRGPTPLDALPGLTRAGR